MSSENESVAHWMVHGLLAHARYEDVPHLIEQLPPGAIGAFDSDLRTIVIEVASGTDANDVLRVLSESGLVAGGVVDDRAVEKYLPDRAAMPPKWDGLGDEWDVCTSCGWTTPHCSTRTALDSEKLRHQRVAHRSQVPV